MKRIAPLLISLMMALAPSIPIGAVLVVGVSVATGCAASPKKKAYIAADATTTAVKTAYRAWLDWLVREEARIAKLPPAEAGPLRAELLRKEGKAIEALGKYNAALQASKGAVEIAYASGGDLPPAVGTAAAELITLITELRK